MSRSVKIQEDIKRYQETSQPASLDRLRYNLVDEMVFNFAMETWQRNQNKHSLYIYSKP